MRIAFERTAFILDLDSAERRPTGQSVRKFERPVLYHLGIESSIRRIVDVFEEDAIHGGLYPGTGLVGLQHNGIVGNRRGICHSDCHC